MSGDTLPSQRPKLSASASKSALRQQMKSLRHHLSPDFRLKASEQLCRRLQTWPMFGQGKAIAGYKAMGREIDPGPALLAAQNLGQNIYFPSRCEDGWQGFSPIDLEAKLATFVRGLFLIPPTSARAERDDVSMVLLPALAVDNNGTRLGYGGGWYDRALLHLGDTCTRVAIVFDEQVVDNLPLEPWDLPVHFIITPERLIEVPAAG